jgi:hypothetical protein
MNKWINKEDIDSKQTIAESVSIFAELTKKIIADKVKELNEKIERIKNGNTNL